MGKICQTQKKFLIYFHCLKYLQIPLLIQDKFFCYNPFLVRVVKKVYLFCVFVSKMVRRSDSSSNEQDNFSFDNYSEEAKKEQKSKKTVKGTRTKKSKIINKSSKKDKETEDKSFSIKKHRQSEEIFIHEDQEQILNINHSLQLQSQNEHDDQSQSQQQSNNSSHPENKYVPGEEVFENLTMKFMVFFNSIEQQNGLVFKGQFRKKLKRKYSGRIVFTDEHHLDPEGQQMQKIKRQIPRNLLIFQKENHNIIMADHQFESYIRQDVEKIISIFKQSCYIFCQQVTHQLYSILRKLCNIVVQYRNQADQELMVSKLGEFGDKIASQNDKDHKYQFFGFQFQKFPEGSSEATLRELQKKEKYKFALKKKYRTPGGQFARFTKKTGLYLQGIIKQLKCYKSLV